MNKKKVGDQASYPNPKRQRRSEPNMDKSAINGKSLNVSENSLDGIDMKEWKMRALQAEIQVFKKEMEYDQMASKLEMEHDAAEKFKLLNQQQHTEIFNLKANYQKLMEKNLAIDEMKKANDKLKETIQTNQQKMEDLAKEKQSLKIRNDALSDANKALKRKETKHAQSMIDKNEEMDETIKSLGLKQNEIVELKAKNEASEQELKRKYESELKKNQQKLLEEYQNKSKLQNEEHKKQIGELKKQNEQQLMEQKEYYEDKQKALIKMEEDVNHLGSVNAVLRNEIEELQKMKKDVENLKSVNAEQQKKIEKSKIMDKVVNNLTSVNEELRTEIAELKEKNENDLKMAKNLREFALNLRLAKAKQHNEIEELKAKNRELTQKNEAVEAKLKIANEKLENQTIEKIDQALGLG